MKLATLLASLTCASAFVAPSADSFARSTRLYEEAEDAPSMMGAAAISALTSVTSTQPKMSTASFHTDALVALVDKVVEIDPGKRAVL
jgi:hypothetical protein